MLGKLIQKIKNLFRKEELTIIDLTGVTYTKSFEPEIGEKILFIDEDKRNVVKCIEGHLCTACCFNFLQRDKNTISGVCSVSKCRDTNRKDKKLIIYVKV